MKAPTVGLMVLGLLLSGPATATIITHQDFSSDPTLSDTRGPGVWWTDRKAPARFESESFMGDDRLVLGLAPDDSEDGFRGTQGRGFDTPGANFMSVDMFIDEDWEDIDGRIGGFWGEGLDSDGNRSMFPIIEFFDNQFQVFDSRAETGDFVWLPVGTPTGFSFGSFVTLSFTLDPGNSVAFGIGGENLLTLDAGPTTEIGAVFLQGINVNPGVDRNLYFDNFRAEARRIPVPGTLALFGAGLIALAAFRRRSV